VLKEEKSFEIEGDNIGITMVRLKASEARGSKIVTDYEFLTDMVGVDFFKKIGKLSDQKSRISLSSKNEIVKRTEFL
jgi:hypothetical protein